MFNIKNAGICCFSMMITAMVSCTKVISVDLKNATPVLVIQGNVYNTAGPYYVALTKTVSFSSDNVYPPLSGATVIITDSTTGQIDHLTETTAGTYATDSIQGTVGHTYLLSVVAGGETYTSSSTMPSPVDLDSITFEKSSFGKDKIYPKVSFQDPAGISNYYLFNVTVNGATPDQTTFTIDDRLSDGRYITEQLFMDSAYIHKGDLVGVQMGCVDKNVYDYFNTLKNSTGNSNTTPGNPTGNITNGALGYFSAQTIQKKTATVN